MFYVCNLLKSVMPLLTTKRESSRPKLLRRCKKGLPTDVILNDALIAAMSRVGQLFEEGEVFVPEMLVAARAMITALTVLKPRQVAQGVKRIGRVAIGTVKGDLHDNSKGQVTQPP